MKSPETLAVFKRLSNPFFLKLFMLLRLPAAFRSGVRLDSLGFDKAVASVPYKRFTQNPFKSTYFACLAMAAEFSSGILVMMAIQGKPSVSMLVTEMRSEFVKKATSRTYFTCEDGEKVFDTIAAARTTGVPMAIETIATGRNDAGDVIARFYITWSVKARKS